MLYCWLLSCGYLVAGIVGAIGFLAIFAAFCWFLCEYVPQRFFPYWLRATGSVIGPLIAAVAIIAMVAFFVIMIHDQAVCPAHPLFFPKQ